jgi:hypothetical protein
MGMTENGAAQHRPFMILAYGDQARLFFILVLIDEKSFLSLKRLIPMLIEKLPNQRRG